MREKFFVPCVESDDKQPIVFLLNDTQIIMESFLEDINNVLNNGEIPNLFSLAEDKNNLFDTMRDAFKDMKSDTDSQLWSAFLKICKKKIHVVLAMSPIGEDFKRRLRMFPSLVNCCAIDWFLPWPKQALQSVAEYFLKEVDDLPQRDGIQDICVDMQLRTTQLTEKYKLIEKKYYYITPTSYLVLIKNFKELLAKKRNEIDYVILKYDRGIKQLA